MAELFGKTLSKADILRYCGGPDSLAGVREYTLNKGRQGGLNVSDVSTGETEFTVLNDRCLDIYDLKYKGVNLAFKSKNGLQSPQYYDPADAEFPLIFPGGFLYTCGLLNAGSSCIDEDVFYPVHGRIANTPANNTGIRTYWSGDDYNIELSGSMTESALFGHNLRLNRTISTSMGAKSFTISDAIENLDPSPIDYIILYHFNFGFPLIDAGTRLIKPNAVTLPRTDEAKQGLSKHALFSQPEDGFFEHVFFHKDLPSDKNGMTTAAIVNDRLKLGVALKYTSFNLPVLVEWKSMRSGDYAVGLEPSNSFISGRKTERANGMGGHLSGFGSDNIQIDIRILDGVDDIESYELNIAKMNSQSK